MEQFTAKLSKDGFANTLQTLPVDMRLTPVSWEASDRGGMKSCEVTATGSAESLAYLCGWLGDRLEIYNAAGQAVWWGVLWDIEVSLGSVQVALSMDNVYNRVKVIYPKIMPDGSQTSRTTAWAEDAASVARYGARELLYSKPASFTSSAETVRDQLLARLKTPGPIISTQGNEYAARLTGQGTFYKAASVYFTNLKGQIENTNEGAVQIVGRHLISTAISFGEDTPGGDDDEIFIGSGDFLPLTDGDSFTISGAGEAANNGTFNVEGMDAADQITATVNFVGETAGATVRISYGDGISYANLAQAFVPDNSWDLTHVALKVAQSGAPSDWLRIGIYTDSAGAPGTLLGYNETLGSSLRTSPTWTEFAFTPAIALTGGTTYHIGIRRTGTASLADGYQIAVDEDKSYVDDLGVPIGDFQVYDGSSWLARDPDAHLAFRVIGEIDSTAQLQLALESVGDFLYALVGVDSDIPVRQYEDSERTALEEIEEMLEAGTATGERLIIWMTQNDAAVVQTPPASDETNLVLGSDGKLRYPNGGQYASGALVFGRYVDVDNLVLLDGLGIRASQGPATYVQGSSYDAATDKLTIYSDDALDPWRALTIRKG